MLPLRDLFRLSAFTVMSTASKLTLVGTTIGALGIVGFVHWAQTAEKAVCPPFALFMGSSIGSLNIDTKMF